MINPISQLSLEQPVVPFDTFVTKVVSRCNLNCSYCYMYNLQDKTWQDQPAIMRPKVRDSYAKRVASHAKRHGLKNVHIILHGGEPLLMGKTRMREWINAVRAELLPTVTPCFGIQSNGVLVDNDWIDLFVELRVGIGISVDGPKRFHDEFRKTHSGRGSFDDVVKGIRCFQQHPRGHEVGGNVLGVVNTAIPPQELFNFWMELDIPGFDISLPHANHAFKPPEGPMTYGQWMVDFFDLWYERNDPRLKVRYFENIMRMLFGCPISTDNIGGKPVGVLVVETNGSIEPTDAFKCCDDGITKLGLNVEEHEFDALYDIDMVRTLQSGSNMLCQTCQKCSLRDICGGGYMPHRYSAENGFDNTSIYCEDISQLVMHIRERMLESIPIEMLTELQMGSQNEKNDTRCDVSIG